MDHLIQLHATPYDISATGFFFNEETDLETAFNNHLNPYGQKVEEFEIQFIDGEKIDFDLFNALKPHQGNVNKFLEVVKEWDEYQKVKAIIYYGELGYTGEIDYSEDPENFDIDLYQLDSMKELAYQFIDDGLFGEIPSHLENYLDVDAMARDLSFDYSETKIGGVNYIYRAN